MNIKNICESASNKLIFRIPTTIIISIILVMSFSTLFPITKAEKSVTLEKFIYYLDKRISNIMEAYGIPGANIALVKGGVHFKICYCLGCNEIGRTGENRAG